MYTAKDMDTEMVDTVRTCALVKIRLRRKQHVHYQ
jgi:hypothetical protein